MRRKNRTARAEGHHPGDYETPKPKHSNYNTARAKVQPRIAWLIGVGAQNAITLSQLAKLTGMSSRDVRRAIQRDRAAGYPICADNKSGYFLPKTEAEKLSCVRSMLHRSAEIRRTARNIESGAVIDADVGGNSGQQKTTISEKNI